MACLYAATRWANAAPSCCSLSLESSVVTLVHGVIARRVLPNGGATGLHIWADVAVGAAVAALLLRPVALVQQHGQADEVVQHQQRLVEALHRADEREGVQKAVRRSHATSSVRPMAELRL